jgi:hypothetical protein
MDDKAAREVVAMQFAAGSSIAGLAEDWEREPEWVEQAIREALLATIPQRDGGLKVPRGAVRAERSEELEQIRGAQSELFKATCDGQE